MIRVRFAPSAGKLVLGHVEVDGVDISNRVTSLTLDAYGGATRLTLQLIITPQDDIDLNLPDEDVTVNATVVKPGGTAVDVTAVSDKARKLVLVPR